MKWIYAENFLPDSLKKAYIINFIKRPLCQDFIHFLFFHSILITNPCLFCIKSHGCYSFYTEKLLYVVLIYSHYYYTPLQNVWHGSKSVVTFGLIKILTHPCCSLFTLKSLYAVFVIPELLTYNDFFQQLKLVLCIYFLER